MKTRGTGIAPRWLALVALAALGAPLVAGADEGMWPFGDVPADRIEQAYGFAPDRAWLAHLRLASLRIAGGCSASLVSGTALVMTNHHCVRRCIDNLSTVAAVGPRRDAHRDGFVARTPADEARCPGMEIDQLIGIEDVTARLQAATQVVAPEAFADAQRGAIAAIEQDCARAAPDELRCEVVPLWRGGRYDLYRYRRFLDVRLAFAPEDRVAYFGGDLENFAFPRHALEVAFLRLVGADGAPVRGLEHLEWGDGSLREGDLVFAASSPRGGSRGLTVAQLEDERDRRLPQRIERLAELRGVLLAFQERGPEQKRQSADLLFSVENSLKDAQGRHQTLADRVFWAQRVKDEVDFRGRVLQDPVLAAQAGGAWNALDALVRKAPAARRDYIALEVGPVSYLFNTARGLLRLADEEGKPAGERLKEYADARLPQVRERLLSSRPVSDELEIATLAWSLAKLREDLGPDAPLVRRILGTRSPAEVAAAAVKGTKLKDLKVDAHGVAIGGARKALLDGGAAALAAAHDPMVELARAYDADARAARRRVETEIDGPVTRLQETLARARFEVYGTAIAPDATSSLRLSYGAVQGWTDGGRAVAPFTTLAGAFERADGVEPFQLPETWTRAKPRLKLDTPLDFVASVDTLGGSSGAALVDRRGRVVGVVFDGNVAWIGGEYGFDAAADRTIAVHAQAVMEALDKIYGAGRLVDEIRGRAPAAAPASASASASAAPR